MIFILLILVKDFCFLLTVPFIVLIKVYSSSI